MYFGIPNRPAERRFLRIRRLCLAATFVLGVALLAPTSSGTPTAAARAAVPYRDASLPVEARVADLLSRMTLAEKIGQMTQAERGT